MKELLKNDLAGLFRRSLSYGSLIQHPPGWNRISLRAIFSCYNMKRRRVVCH